MKRQRSRNRGGGGGGGGGGGKPTHNVNRAFDSNGPDGVKIRGHAQHVFEKYQQLARDAASSGDRVLAENYLQHAEHYFRVLRAVQPQRPAAEILGRDAFTSGIDIDFEDENPSEAVEGEGAEQPVEDGGEGQAQREQRGENGRQDYRSDNRQDGRQDNRQEARQDNRGEYRSDRRPDYRPGEDRGGYRDNRPDRPSEGRQDGRPDRYEGRRDERGFNRDDRPRDDRPRDDRPRDDRPRDDRPRDDRPRDDRPRDDRPRDDRPRDDRPRDDRPREQRGYRDDRQGGRFEPRGDRPNDRQDRSRGGDPMAVVEPEATPLTPERRDDNSPTLRSGDGGFSPAPAFLQSRVEAVPADLGEEPAPPPRRRARAKREAEPSAPATAEES